MAGSVIIPWYATGFRADSFEEALNEAAAVALRYGATSGYQLDFDVRYLWMRQKEILGSHFANAYECTKANELIESGQIRPVLWRTLGFEGVAEAHQLMLENKHLGKISILVGADSEGQGKTADGPGAIRAEVGA